MTGEDTDINSKLYDNKTQNKQSTKLKYEFALLA